MPLRKRKAEELSRVRSHPSHPLCHPLCHPLHATPLHQILIKPEGGWHGSRLYAIRVLALEVGNSCDSGEFSHGCNEVGGSLFVVFLFVHDLVCSFLHTKHRILANLLGPCKDCSHKCGHILLVLNSQIYPGVNIGRIGF